ncbi:spore germination protein KA [Anaerovirgula multivorans]|uniref:Spore germination protein KA n=1 Tax=Anaerovirgula multivorans TaxID=312168 RepID=A0A239JXE6_9FIRM|nr:spore germination protein [Anaerovirgula multivorans]SNT10093.1 spore germination protein KA [Anaerovirgula multivorans]
MKFPKKIFKHPKPLIKGNEVSGDNEDNEVYSKFNLSESIGMNRKHLETIFEDCDDIIYREVKLYRDEEIIDLLLIYTNNLVDAKEINENVIKPIGFYSLANNDNHMKEEVILDTIEEIVSVHAISRVNNFEEIVATILLGNTVLLIEHYDVALILNTVGGDSRSIEESPVENIIRGPRDSFIENIHTNIGLIRQKIKSPSLKAKNLIIGSESQTIVSVIYMESIVNKQALENIINKLNEIQIDGIFDSGYIEQYLESSPYSPFPQMQITERPDKVCGNLLEGKIIILVDGSPMALILPISFFQLFQSPEDYYERVLYGNFTRLLRLLGFIIATSLPSVYVALISFHHEMLPMDLVIDLSRTRAQVPFPPVIEALLMELTIEFLREASARLPGTIGQTVGIVGAIVIGEAAIQAHLASPTMVIVVAITALGSYILPHYSTSYALRMIRFPIILMAATFGAFGIIIAWSWVIVHLCSLESFGYPYLSPLAPLDADVTKDALIRGSLRRFKERPKTSNQKNQTRW